MQLLVLMFVFGAWLLQRMPSLPVLYWLGLLVLPALLAFLLRRDSTSPRLHIKRGCLLLVAGGAGFFWAAGFAQFRLADDLPREWEGQDVQIIGIVASLPQLQERGERFEFDVERVLTSDARIPGHISLTSYVEGFGTASPQANTALFHPGQRWQITVRLKRPHGAANPYGFDFESWALERNIRATGYVRKDQNNKILTAFVTRPGYMVEAVRERIRQRMQSVLGDAKYGGILQALVIGDEDAIGRQQWQVFLRTGTSHLMSISGLHITMLAGLAFGLAYAGWRRVEKLALRLPARKAAVVAGLLTATCYALVAGCSVPTQRTIYMLAVFAIALWSGRHISILLVLCWALLLVVLLDPWAVLAPGFWLSFGAVAVIAYATVGRLRRPHWLREAVHTQWAVTLGLLPLLLVLFQQASIISPLANALAIPLVSLVVVPLALLGALLPIDLPLHLSHEVMAGCMIFLDWSAGLPGAIWQQHAPASWTLPVAVLGVLWLLLPRGFPMRWLGLAGLLPMFLVAPAAPQSGAMQVAILDIGQGLAVMVRTADHTLLYDAGPRFTSQSDSGSRIVVPYLRGAGINRLDGFMVSHNDTDHSGGMASVLAQLPVGWLATSLLAQQLPAMNGTRLLPCYAGQSWTWDEVHFQILHPALASYGSPDIKDNDRSCVLRITSRYGSLMLAGDIERTSELELLNSSPQQLAADVLVVPHHGSKTSSSAEFIAAVHPALAVFTTGYRNRFGHPKKQVVERYQQQGSRIYRSDRDGALLLDFGSTGVISVRQWRQEAQRYWQDVPALAENGTAG